METRPQKAAERKRCGKFNCAQSVAGVFADMVKLDEATLNAATSAFGTGMGTTEGTCGALVGAGVIAGLLINDRVQARQAMKQIMETFLEANGSTVCRELKGIDTGRPLRDCPSCCADAARFLLQVLHESGPK